MYKTLLDHIKEITPHIRDDEFNMIIKLISIREYPKQTILWEQGKYVKEGGYVYKGCLRQFMRNAEGQERTTSFAMEDYWIGEYSSILKGEPSAQSVETIEDTVLLGLKSTDYKYLLDNNESFRQFTYIKRSRAFDAALKHIVDLHEPSEVRYTNLTKKYPSALMRIPLYHIASYLGITPESLSRLRKKMSCPNSSN